MHRYYTITHPLFLIKMDISTPLISALLANGPVKSDGYTYFLYGGKLRQCKSKRRPKKTRTEGELQVSNRFTEARKMWKIYRRAIGDLPIWRAEARKRGVSKSDSLFHTINNGCLKPGEGVWALKTFRFSVGSLDAPMITNATRDGWKISLQWENGIDCPSASASDRVFVGYFYDSLRRSPCLLHNISACRGDGQATIEIPSGDQPEGTPLHLYLFFGDNELARFSPSEYVQV